MPLFLNLLENGIMATRILQSNQKYVPREIFSKKITRTKDMGWIDYCMHQEGKICCVVWKDKQAVFMLLTHADPIPLPTEQQFVWRKILGKKKKVKSGPMHLQCTRNMIGVDIVDQLQGTYSYLSRSHKWWHHLFCYMLDTTISNMWIIHSDFNFQFLTNPIMHLDFQMQLAKALSAKWASRNMVIQCLLHFF